MIKSWTPFSTILSFNNSLLMSTFQGDIRAHTHAHTGTHTHIWQDGDFCPPFPFEIPPLENPGYVAGCDNNYGVFIDMATAAAFSHVNLGGQLTFTWRYCCYSLTPIPHPAPLVRKYFMTQWKLCCQNNNLMAAYRCFYSFRLYRQTDRKTVQARWNKFSHPAGSLCPHNQQLSKKIN